MEKQHNSIGQGKLALVTGASGFIGSALVRRLLDDGYRVRALVRKTSSTDWLEQQGCELAVGDVVQDPASIREAAAGVDVVFHLAAETRAIRSPELVERNLTGARNVFEALVENQFSGRCIYVSSLAAVGPTERDRPIDELAPRHPVSYYGQSKAACEREAYQHAGRLDIAIVRPPIVLGPGDHSGLQMFKSIQTTRIHFVPGFINRVYSVVHVDDLAQALLVVAERGKRLATDGDGEGIYFVACDQAGTFSELGRWIGKAMGYRRTFVIKVAKPVMWITCLINEAKSRLSGNSVLLDLDKFREGFAGSWFCSNQKLKSELGFQFDVPLPERLKQTVEWYRDQGWLKPATEKHASADHGQEKSRTESYG